MFYFYFAIFSHLLFDIYIPKNVHIHNFQLSTFNNKNIIFDSSFFSSESSESFDSSDDCPENCESCVNKTYCNSCIDDKFYGDICQNNCSNNCLEQKCLKDNGTCQGCENGYFGNNCSLNCSEKCENKICEQKNGFCLSCADHTFYGDKCDQKCDETCKDETCNIDGTCVDCDLDKHFGENKSFCIDCSEKCINKKCDTKTGECDKCKPYHYGLDCNNTCNGCLYGCEMSNGDCVNNICINSFYNSKCEQKCDDLCQDKSCDMFTGKCVIKCNNNFKWGNNCNNITNDCSSDCNDHSKYPYVTADCCLIKNQILNKLKNEFIEIYSYYNKSYDVHMINLITNDDDIIPIVVDFNSNANLIIFTEHGVTFKNINDKKKIHYNSSLFYKTNTNSTILDKNLINYISGLNITGNLIRDNFILKTNNNGYINLDITFLDPTSIDKVDHNYFFSGDIQGFVGLGILSQFIFQLYNDSLISNNIHSISNLENNNKLIKLGDYTDNIKNNPENLTNIKNEERDNNKNLKNISFVNTNIYQISLIGIYYNKKIYKIKDVNVNLVTLDFNSNSSIILPSSFNNFFELIYFGNYMDKECSVSGTNIIEYICDENIAEYLPDIGLYFQDYIYYIPKNIFFIEGTNRFKFLISLKEKTVKINIGKNFLYNYTLVFKNGFKNISFFNEVKNSYKAYQNDIEMVDIDNFSFNIKDSYGRNVSVFIFCFFGLIILIYLIYLCQKYQNYCCSIEDEDDEIDSMLELN